MSQRTCILVLGMHRSGTSAVARALNLAGATLPQTLLPPSDGNPLGHWESEPIVEFCSGILGEFGRRWNDLSPIDIDSMDAAWIADRTARLGALIVAEFGSSDLFVLKDPRLCLLAPLALGALDALGIEVRVVLVLRQPSAVAASLERRSGMTADFSRLVWLQHMLAAESATRDRRRTVVSFETLVEGGMGVAGFLGDVGLASDPDAVEAATSSIRNEHVHARWTPADTPVGRLAQDAHDVLNAQAAARALDAIAAALKEIEVAGPAITAELHARERLVGADGERTRDRLSHLEAGLLEAQAERHALQVQIDSVSAERDGLAADVQWLKEARRGPSAELVKHRETLRLLEGRIAQADRDIVLGRAELETLRRSVSWRLTAPVRLAGESWQAARHGLAVTRLLARVTTNSLRINGIGGTIARARRAITRGLLRKSPGLQGNAADAFYPGPVASPANERLANRVLIIGELSIPQCTKYRVTQKREMLTSLGVDASVVDWRDTEACRSALQVHSCVIFYRVPAFSSVLGLIAEARRLKLRVIWEVDDLIFDAAAYSQNRNLESLAPGDREGILAGAALYRTALELSDEAIASTSSLAQAMRRFIQGPVHVIENALDPETVALGRKFRRSRAEVNGIVRIVYGSGSNTHNADFAVAAPGLLAVLRQQPNVRLCIVGELVLPPEFEALAGQVERLPLVPFPRYMEIAANCDIAIAPLEPSLFNDAKSNIKYLEAAILSLPVVCSPAAAFAQVVDDGSNGFLARTTEEWADRLGALARDAALRRRLGVMARRAVTRLYTPIAIARRQVAPVLTTPRSSRARPRLLMANIYFSPRRFGGATIIAEEMASRLTGMHGWDVAAYTTWENRHAPAGAFVRYDVGRVDVIATRPYTGAGTDLGDPAGDAAFRTALRAYRPDIVQLHSIQGLGASLAEVCRSEGIPYVVTLHDPWWLCERQFMVRPDHTPCRQYRIDPAVCARCVDDAAYNRMRTARMKDLLQNAAMLLSPSRYFADFYRANGVGDMRLKVNKNGVQLPAPGFRRSPADRVRLGYVGGETPIKGAALIRAAVRQLQRSDYELVVVDNTINLGFASILPSQWKSTGKLTIVPGYNAETMDKFFSSIDVLLFPTQYAESFGMTVREALARDIWVIATAGGGPVEDLRDGVNGRIIPMEDTGPGLARAITEVLERRPWAFENPHRAEIRSYDEQADELSGLLTGVLAAQ